jgi:hypothetical protein
MVMFSGHRLLVACWPRLYIIALPPYKTLDIRGPVVRASIIETVNVTPREYIPGFDVPQLLKLNHNGDDFPQEVAVWSAGHIHLISVSSSHATCNSTFTDSFERYNVPSGLRQHRGVRGAKGEFAVSNTIGLVKWRNGGSETFVLVPSTAEMCGIIRLDRKPSAPSFVSNGGFTIGLFDRENVFHLDVDEESGLVFALTGRPSKPKGTIDIWRMCICTLA